MNKQAAKATLLRHNIRMQVRAIDVAIDALQQAKKVLQNDTASAEPLRALKQRIQAANTLHSRMVEESARIIALSESE